MTVYDENSLLYLIETESGREFSDYVMLSKLTIHQDDVSARVSD